MAFRAKIALVSALLLSPCAPAPPVAASSLSSEGPAAARPLPSVTLRWNEVARGLVRKNLVDPLWAVRTYALMSIAQHEAARMVARTEGARDHDAALVGAAVARSSATVLARLYPHEIPRVSADLQADMDSLRQRAPDDPLEAGIAAGEAAARAVLDARQDDGSLSLEAAVRPPGAGRWHSSERWPPLRPGWGNVRPFLVRDIERFAVLPPPAVESEAFKVALATVREYTQRASARLDGMARKWADGPGTATPPGHWNEIAAEIIAHHGTGEAESARLLAMMNMAMMDASIVCWRTKFQHWLLRPPHADPQIVPSLPLPNFPAYPSGHAAFSGAASAFLARRFPSEADTLAGMAEEAALSRVVSGIHYPFDSEEGLRQGRRIAELAIAEYERGAPLLAEVRTSRRMREEGR